MGFPCQNVGEIDFPSPVERSNVHVAFSNFQHLLSSASYSPLIPFMIKSSIKKVSL